MGRLLSPTKTGPLGSAGDADEMISELLGVSREDLPSVIETLTSSMFSSTDSSWSPSHPARSSLAFAVTDGLSKALNSRSPMLSIVSLATKLKTFKQRTKEIKDALGAMTATEASTLDRMAMCVPESILLDVKTDWTTLVLGPEPEFHPLIKRLL